jgi:hypothetical protein
MSDLKAERSRAQSRNRIDEGVPVIIDERIRLDRVLT